MHGPQGPPIPLAGAVLLGSPGRWAPSSGRWTQAGGGGTGDQTPQRGVPRGPSPQTPPHHSALAGNPREAQWETPATSHPPSPAALPTARRQGRRVSGGTGHRRSLASAFARLVPRPASLRARKGLLLGHIHPPPSVVSRPPHLCSHTLARTRVGGQPAGGAPTPTPSAPTGATSRELRSHLEPPPPQLPGVTRPVLSGDGTEAPTAVALAAPGVPVGPGSRPPVPRAAPARLRGHEAWAAGPEGPGGPGHTVD